MSIWTVPEAKDPKLTDPRAIIDLLKPYPFEDMKYCPVSKDLNKTKNDNAELIKPLAA